jgi:peptide deformylase
MYPHGRYGLDVTVAPIRIAGDPALHTPTLPVEPIRFSEHDDADLRALVADMFETMYVAEGVGLAANQIGVGLRVFVYDCPDAEGGWHRGTVVNPTVTATGFAQSADPDADLEGCLSVPGERYPTRRGAFATVSGFDVAGNAITVHGTGTLARCFQHETDHLDGLLYLDRLTGEPAAAAKRMLVTHGWGGPGHSWQPELPDEFAGSVIDRTTVLLGAGTRERGPLVAPLPDRDSDATSGGQQPSSTSSRTPSASGTSTATE